MAKQRKTFFQENGKILAVLLLPLVAILVAIIGLILYDTSRGFRNGWNAFWASSPEPEQVVAQPLSVVPPVPTFREKHVSECGAMPNKFIVENLGDDSPIDLNPSLGLHAGADDDAVEDRCKDFAKIVYSMENLSKHRHHAFLCPGVRFSVGRGYGFIADPEGRGVLLAGDDPQSKDQLIELPMGQQTIYQNWQFYNPGGGCVVMGYSSRRSRTLELFERK